jgi:hypothetical protein
VYISFFDQDAMQVRLAGAEGRIVALTGDKVGGQEAPVMPRRWLLMVRLCVFVWAQDALQRRITDAEHNIGALTQDKVPALGCVGKDIRGGGRGVACCVCRRGLQMRG